MLVLGKQDRSQEELFVACRLGDLIPADHILRRVDAVLTVAGTVRNSDSILTQSRNSLGLETTNTGQFVSHGTIIDNGGVFTKVADPWGRFAGGGQETIIPSAFNKVRLDAVTMPDTPLPWRLPTDPRPLP